MKIQISGLNTIDEDLDKFKQELDKTIKSSLKALQPVVIQELQYYIETRYYALYSPVSYKRRYDNRNLGIPMIDKSYMQFTNVTNKSMVFVYEPETNYLTEKGWEEGRKSDELLEWQSEKHSYESGIEIPARPYWDEFVDSYVLGGQIETDFVVCLNTYAKDLQAKQVGNGVVDDNQATRFKK